MFEDLPYNSAKPRRHNYLCVISKQLLEDLQRLKDLYAIPFPRREDIWHYEWTAETIHGAIENLPSCPQFEYMAAPGKSRGEFLVSWRKLEDLTAKCAIRFSWLDSKEWPADEVVTCEVLRAIGEARPCGVTQRRYSGHEARFSS